VAEPRFVMQVRRGASAILARIRIGRKAMGRLPHD
jgi:hypothetical protein